MAIPINPKFIQAQSFALQASGASAGDTVLNVQSFLYPDGVTQIVTADLGDWCFGTLEPNNGTQEEAIQFTGVTQNANGTAQLTGVSSVGFKSPYTVTSGLSKSHAGGVTFVISNDAAMYGNLVTYFDTTLASGIAPNATSTIKGVVQIPTAAQINSSTATGSTGASLAITPDQLALSNYGSAQNYVVNVSQKTGLSYTVAGGTSTAYTATVASAISTLASGTSLNFLVPVSNASGVTLNVNSLGAVPITKQSNSTLASGNTLTNTLASGDLTLGQIAQVTYDGTKFQLISPTSLTLSYVNSGATTHDISSTTTTVIPHNLGVTPRIVRINGSCGSSKTGGTSFSVYSNGSLSSNYILSDDSTGTYAIAGGTGNNLYGAGASAFITYTISVDGTNIYLSWTKNTSPTGTAFLVWEAIA